MKALSLTQPWASLVAIGAKQIETRSWTTGYRGWLAIHAAKGWPLWAQQRCMEEPFHSTLTVGGFFRPRPGQENLQELVLPRGAIVAVVNLHKVGEIFRCYARTCVRGQELPIEGKELEFGDFYPGRFGWVLTGGYRLKEPIPCKGALNLWDVPEEVLAEINQQLGKDWKCDFDRPIRGGRLDGNCVRR